VTRLVTEFLEESRRLGFVGPGSVNRHMHHALAFAESVPAPPARALDLGAGGGLPGLVLAVAAWPDTEWCLLDASQRKTQFLASAVAAFGVGDRVEVVTGRAEEAGREPRRRAGYDLVVARSFAVPAVVAECGAPFLSIGGLLVVSEPPEPRAPRWPTEGLHELGLGPACTTEVESGSGPVHLAVMALQQPTGERYPRRSGVPTKRPLFVTCST